MKNLYLCVITLACIATLSGCNHNTKKEEISPLVDVYRQAAVKLIEIEDYENAAKALTEGIELTNDEYLKQMLAEVSQRLVIDTEPTNSSGTQLDETRLHQEPNIPDKFLYLGGIWAEESIGWKGGGMIADIEVNNAGIDIIITFTQSAPASRVAELSYSIPFNTIENNTVMLSFDNDGWGNSGYLTLIFGDQIICKIYDLIPSNLAQWGLYEGEYILFRNDTAHKLMTYTEEEYIENYVESQNQNCLDVNNQKKINIFLSNFAEQHFEKYPVTDNYCLLQFAYKYSQINNPALISYTDYSAYMSQVDVDNILKRFFGKTITPSDNSMIFYSPVASEEYIAYGANLYEFVIGADFHNNYIAIAHNMSKNGDGTYQVLFDIYRVDLDSFSAYYGLTAAEARNISNFSLYQHGSAVVRDYTQSNGKETYQLISYRIN